MDSFPINPFARWSSNLRDNRTDFFLHILSGEMVHVCTVEGITVGQIQTHISRSFLNSYPRIFGYLGYPENESLQTTTNWIENILSLSYFAFAKTGSFLSFHPHSSYRTNV